MYSQVFSDSLSRSVVTPFTIMWNDRFRIHLDDSWFIFRFLSFFLGWFWFFFPMEIDCSDNLSQIIIECISTFTSSYAPNVYISKSTKNVPSAALLTSYAFIFICVIICAFERVLLSIVRFKTNNFVACEILRDIN